MLGGGGKMTNHSIYLESISTNRSEEDQLVQTNKINKFTVHTNQCEKKRHYFVLSKINDSLGSQVTTYMFVLIYSV